MESYTILIADGVVSASTLPTTDEVKAADTVFLGGSDYTVSGAVAQQIYNAGFGRWLTEVA
jgi:hypothetical protein